MNVKNVTVKNYASKIYYSLFWNLWWYFVAVCKKHVKFSLIWENNYYRVPWEEGCSTKEGTEKQVSNPEPWNIIDFIKKKTSDDFIIYPIQNQWAVCYICEQHKLMKPFVVLLLGGLFPARAIYIFSWTRKAIETRHW